MSQGEEAEEDMQRVRLLSTLESARKPQRRAPSKSSRSARGRRASWQVKASIGLMGTGVLALLLSFVMVVREGHPPAPALAVAAAPSPQAGTADWRGEGKPPARSTGPLGVLQNAPSPETPSVQASAALAPRSGADMDAHTPERRPATIESILATAPPAAPLAMPHDSPSPSTQASLPPSPPVTPAPSPATIASPAKGTASATPRPGPSASTATATAPADTRAAATRRKASSKDEDVALVEAMFEHASPRRQTALAAAAATNPSVGAKASPDSSSAVSDELQRRCANLSGPEAATCRAKVCVQSPKAAACHAD